MPVPRGQAQALIYTAWDFTANTGKTGDSANHTLRLVRDGIESVPTNSPSEIDATDVPGLYKLNLTASEMDAGVIVLAGKSATVGVSLIPIEIATET